MIQYPFNQEIDQGRVQKVRKLLWCESGEGDGTVEVFWETTPQSLLEGLYEHLMSKAFESFSVVNWLDQDMPHFTAESHFPFTARSDNRYKTRFARGNDLQARAPALPLPF